MDAILAKKESWHNAGYGTPLTIALGPGFTAGQDVDVVVETKRGHRLGRIIREGSAIPDTGIPGIIGGYGKERVIHAGTAGIFMDLREIGDIVEAGETIAQIRTADGAMISVTTQITGILRGLLRSSYPVTPGFKVADIDPRKEELSNCFLISDKARCIAGIEKLFHGSFSFDFSIPERPAGCKPHNACYYTRGKVCYSRLKEKYLLFFFGFGVKKKERFSPERFFRVPSLFLFFFLPLTLCRGSCLGV